MLLAVASQPAAPVRFENPKLLMSTDGSKLTVGYTLRNTGTKPIKYLTSVMWTSFATGGTLADSESTGLIKNTSLMPGQTVDHSVADIQLTETIKEKLRLNDPLKAIIILMVQQVTFTDDTVYDDKATSSAVLRYFETVSDAIESQKKRAVPEGKP